MPRTQITKDWSIDIDDDFERKVEEGDLMLHKPGRTIYAAVYSTNNLDAERAITRMLEGRPGRPTETFDRAEAGVSGYAYLLPETSGDHSYWGLNTWTAVKGSVACVTIYFDSEADLQWALDAWRSIQFGPGKATLFN